MEVNIKEGKFKIFFGRVKEVRVEKFRPSPGVVVSIERRYISTIVNIQNDEKSYIGASTCNPEDVFVKETGRVLALKNVSKHFDKEDRTKIFDAYYGRK